MPVKEHVKTIGKHQYKYITMTMTPAVELLGLLSTTAGDALAPLSRGLTLDGEIDPGVIAQCVAALLAKLGKSDEVLEVIRRVNKQGVVVKNKQASNLDNVAELHFGENFDELPGWLTFALGEQFTPFFASLLPPGIVSAAKNLMAKAAEKKGQTFPTMSASGGPSSESLQTNA